MGGGSMAAVVLDEPGTGMSDEGSSSMQGQCSQSGEAVVEWRSSDQVENGMQLTTAPYWDTDNDDDGGPKPSELFGRYTWKIEKFSQITKRELRSSAFEVGGYKWYILIYPQGCDVCNHLSLFLCVANHDKLLPGWSHFAQFTIAVVNKDPKKSKYSDTLHRFWKKEHDWGWKKFMELAKMIEGFVDEDTLIIKAQVQVIREKADRPFRCLDSQYRRELVRVYLTNVEQICRRFVEERRGKLVKLIEDKARWTSFCAFWMDIDPDSRRSMSRENTDVILKVVVKHFFIEKEVTSTLVMDSLYSGLKALESQSKNKKGKAKKIDADDMPDPIVRVEQDTFVLVDDALPLLERAAVEPLPPKDEKGPQNRTKDGNSGEDFNKDSIERDERRLTELGRRTVEIFVLAHIFSNKIEVAYQEAVALKRQEELIREEEAAWQAESEQKAKRASVKEKKSKKKLSKQKRNSRKAKDKEREDQPITSPQGKTQQEKPHHNVKEDLTFKQVRPEVEKAELLEDASDISDLIDCVGESLLPDSEERDASPINWDTDTSEFHPPTEPSKSGDCSLSSIQNCTVNEKRGPFAMDDSSSTCSSDSVPSVVTSGSFNMNSFPSYKNKKSPSRGKSQRFKAKNEISCEDHRGNNGPGLAAVGVPERYATPPIIKAVDVQLKVVVPPLQFHGSQHESHSVKLGEAPSQQKPSPKDQIDEEKLSKEKAAAVQSPSGFLENSTSNSRIQVKSDHRNSSTHDATSARKASSASIPQQIDKAINSSQVAEGLKPEGQKATTPKPPENSTSSQVPMMPRPSSAPMMPGVRPPAPAISVVQSAPPLARSVSAVGRLGPDSTSTAPSYAHQSYRNAIIGNSIPSSSSAHAYPSSPNSGTKSSRAFSRGPNIVPSSPMFVPPSERFGFPLGAISQDMLSNGLPQEWLENINSDKEIQKMAHYKSNVSCGSRGQMPDPQAGSSGCQAPGILSDDFPHLDIINDLLDEEHGIAKLAWANPVYPQSLNRQYSFPGEVGVLGVDTEASASWRFERTRSYRENGFQRGYNSFSGGLDSVGEYSIPQVSHLPYASGVMDGMIPNHWNVANSDLSVLRTKSNEGEGYPFYSPDYSNLACGVNGYNSFRPPSSH
ncbi:hypothetical protein SAY87_028258 [Trapa incisa]|uniref:MATH domain-containing protein n=1 Tax=Trapa incisa TaxID=236973 RepID=A0AAN7QNG7_9MYRT|nr:hypothetical protein SAY87_028258 [Trapa incisa]